MTMIVERRYVSRYGTDVLGIVVYVAGVQGDADGNAVQVTMRRADGPQVGEVVFARPATRLETGRYAVTLTSAETDDVGTYDLTFGYTVSGISETYVLPVQVGQASQAYDDLAPGFKDVVESVWTRFQDLYDSPHGGPHLQVYLQTNFGRQRLAQLLRQSVGRLNTVAQPHMSYGLDREFPFESWGALLEQGLYLEVIKHLIRSYTEQPETVLGVSISRNDRRDYMSRWTDVLKMEEGDLRAMMDNFKMAHMGLGSVSVLVAGGAYGRGMGATYPGAGAAMARGYFAVRRW